MYRNRFGVVWPRVEPFFQSLRESTDLPIGVIGYCWGGKREKSPSHQNLLCLERAFGPCLARAAKRSSLLSLYCLTDAVVLAHDATKSSSGKSLIDAAYTAHPSNLSIPDEIQKLKIPILFSQGTKDVVLPMTQVKQIQEIFDTKNKAEVDEGKGERYQIKVVENAKHSFAVRGDPNDKEELAQAQIAEDQAVEWFEKWLLKK